MRIPVISGLHPITTCDFLAELEKRLGALPSDLHVSRMFTSLVAISEGKVIGMTEPYMEYCPLAVSLYGRMSRPGPDGVVEGVCRSVQKKVKQFGYYTSCREVRTHRLAIPFGASEMMMRAMLKGLVDAAVVVCEGAGTVIAPSAELIQGIGARMNGLFHTSAISETITKIEQSGGIVPFPDTAAIDQIGGLDLAMSMGYRNVAVTVNAFQGEELLKVREVEDNHNGRAFILGVCTTGIDDTRAQEFADHADLVWACASDEVRHLCGAKARIQVTTKIPVFVMTEVGVEFLSMYATRPEAIANLDPNLQYLVSNTIDGSPVTLGKVPTRIAAVESLPVTSPDSPRLEEGCLTRTSHRLS